MIEKDVAEISQLLGVEKDIVVASEKDGTLSTRIQDSIKKNFIPKSDHEAFKNNYKVEVETAYYNDLVEKAKKQDLPQDLFKPIYGAAMQKKERELSQKFGVTDFQNLDDLVEKAISKTSANGKTLPEYETKIKELQDANVKLKKEADDALKTTELKYKTQSIERDLNDFVNKVPHDFSGFKPEELQKASLKVKNILKSVFIADGYSLDYNDKGKPIVKGKDGNVLKDTATLEPIDPVNVMISLAKEYGQKLTSPDPGGQGGSSSRQSSAGFTDTKSFNEWCASQGIDKFSKEALKAWKASGLGNK